MASAQMRPEPMNASPHHSKVKVSMTLGNSIFVAGTHVSGKMEMECRADKGLGIGVMMVELFASQELTSRDHSATSTFLHSKRVFQGPGLPPSNAVQPYPAPGDPPLPQNYHQARRGVSTFLFRIPIPSSAPSSISFGSDIARVKYELRASVGVFWKGEKRLVTNKRDLDVVESYEQDFSRAEPEGTIVGEHGKIWAQGRVVGGIAVAGESACVELQVKNHSTKKNTGLILTLTRTLLLPGVNQSEKALLQLSDVLLTVPFRGPEYIIPPGAEGVASLVFDIPKHARGVRGGTLEGDESEARTSESLFEVRCVIGIKIAMGIGSKDINLDLPVTIVHPAALPELPDPNQYVPPAQYPYVPQTQFNQSPYVYPALPISPPIPAYSDQNQIWSPPPVATTPQPYLYYSPNEGQQPQYYFPPPPTLPVFLPPRPLSAGAPSDPWAYPAINAPMPTPQHLLLPLDIGALHPVEPEEGKGERATRVTHHLRLSSRNRSVSPQSHRFPLSASHALPKPPSVKPLRNLPPPPPITTTNLSVSQDSVVYSPRPHLSPKHSYTSVTHNSIPKSERVEELERMAAEVLENTIDLSADIPKISAQPTTDDVSNINKTLPAPPLPSRKEKRSTLPERKRVDTYFATDTGSVPEPESHTPQPIPSDRTPPTPTLTAVTPAKLPKADHLNSLPMIESGLDALERRLLAEVGTKKIELVDRRPDVRSIVQPIAIPNKEPSEPLNDSAISSLTLAGEHDHDSDEKTHRAGKSSVSGDEWTSERRRKKIVKEEKSKSDNEAKVGEGSEKKKKKEKERTKDREGHKSKKSAAKGRVAAWLGEIEPDIPPPEEPVPLSPIVINDNVPFTESNVGLTAQMTPEENLQEQKDDALLKAERDVQGVSSAPNPRSSGFVPIGSLKRDSLQRYPIMKEITVVEEARRVADIWSSSSDVKDKSARLPLDKPPAESTELIETGQRPSPLSFTSTEKPDIRNKDTAWQNGKLESVFKSASPLPKKVVQPSPRLPVFPPTQPDPEVKYDIRSARGGRGGRVTAVASIWASGGAFAEPKSRNVQRKTPDLSLTPKPAKAPIRPLISTEPSSEHVELAGTRKTQKLMPDLSVTPKPTRTSANAMPTTVPLSKAEPQFSGKRMRPVVKSTSVPAIISSSHAIPMLSSTASLARPSPLSPRKAKSSVKVPTTISETIPDGVAKGQSPVKPAFSKPSGDLAFGQARLRDLIKKYQGQGT